MPLDSAPSPPPADDLDPIFEEAGQRFGVDPNLLRTQAGIESGGNRYAISPAGAVGIMQVKPDTYNELRQQYPDLSANPFQARSNIMAGAAYLRQMHDQFGPTGAVAAYNAGPGRYQDYLNGDAPLPDETQAYVAKVSDAYQKRSQQQPAPAPKPPDVRALIDASRKMGASDDEIRAQMQKSPMLSGLWKQSDAAGIPRTDVFAHFGLQPQGKPGQSGLPMAQRDTGTYQTDPKLISTGGTSPGAAADDKANGAPPGPTDNIPGIYEENTSQPAPLPRGNVGTGIPYQGGMDFNLPGGQRTFTPGDVKVPGQTIQQATRAAIEQGANTGFGVIPAVAGVGAVGQGLEQAYGRHTLAAFDLIDKGTGPAAAAHTLGLSPIESQKVSAYAHAPPDLRPAMRAEMGAYATAPPNAAMRANEQINQSNQRNYPIDPSQEGFVTGAARGITELPGMLATTAAGTAVGGPTGGVLATAAFIGSQFYGPVRQEALAKGASPDVADRAATESALTNAGIMVLPVGRVLNAAPQLKAGVWSAIQRLATHGVEFSNYNALSTFIDNYIAKSNYDPDRALSKNVGQSAGVGFVMGLAMATPGVVFHGTPPAPGASASDTFARGARSVGAAGQDEGFTPENEIGAPPAAPPGPAAPSGTGPEAPTGTGPRAPAAPTAAPAPPPDATGARPPATSPAPAAPTQAETVLANIAAGKPATGGVEALQAMAQGKPAAAQPAAPAPQQAAPAAQQARPPSPQPPHPVSQPSAPSPPEEPQSFDWATAKVGDRLPDGRGVIASKGMTRPDAQALSDQQNGTVWADGLGPDGKPRYGVVVPEREQVAEGVEVQRPPEDKPGRFNQKLQTEPAKPTTTKSHYLYQIQHLGPKPITKPPNLS